MEDLRSILSHHKNNHQSHDSTAPIDGLQVATTSEIPDLFFDEILVHFKLSRVEIIVLMHLYRITWCRPNLYKKFGISPIVALAQVAEQMEITYEVLYQAIRKVETLGFLETIRPGQYFVRKFFTEDNDRKYGQTYDNFL